MSRKELPAGEVFRVLGTAGAKAFWLQQTCGIDLQKQVKEGRWLRGQWKGSRRCDQQVQRLWGRDLLGGMTDTEEASVAGVE